MDNEEINLVKLIKARGYVFSKDNLGSYFDNGKNKFSILHIGTIYNCYLNEKNETGYVLKDTLLSQLLIKQCLFWILNNC